MRPLTFLALLGSTALLAPALPANPGGSGGSAPSRSAPTFDAASEYRKGVESLEAKRFSDASKSFRKVLGVAPRDANLHYLAGLASAGENDLKEARKHYERAVRYDENLVAARQELGILYARTGERAKAEAELATLKQRASACAGSCKEAAELSQAVGAVETALAAPQASRIVPRLGLLFESDAGDHAYLTAVSLINEGRYAEALDELEAARAAFGAHPDVLTYLGFANRKLKRFEEAERWYQAALAAEPGHRGATEYYGELMLERGDRAGAAAMLARLETLCTFGCAEADELRRWIEAGRSPAS